MTKIPGSDAKTGQPNTCLPGQIVPITVGRGSWGPQFQGQH
jgi:hypothetical protein